jgi:YVTN family beta-propeller protein
MPTYQVGAQTDGSVVTSVNQVVTPAGKQIPLPLTRVNAVAIRPDNKTAAALTMDSKAPIRIMNLATGAEIQEFTPQGGTSGAIAGLRYSADGKTLYASQDSGNIVVATVAADGTLSSNTVIPVPKNPAFNDNGYTVPNNAGLALSADGTKLYVAINRYNALGVIDLLQQKYVGQIPVGNAPNSVVVVGDRAYVSNEGGRVATAGDFTVNSSGTNIVADRQTGAAITGTVSVVDLTNGKTIQSIAVGLHPTAMTLDGPYLFVANTNSDSVSVIDTRTNWVVQTLPVRPFDGASFGSSPNGLVMTPQKRLYVTLGTNNAIAVYNWQAAQGHDYTGEQAFGNGDRGQFGLEGLIPTGWFPGSIAYNAATDQLLVGNVKGTGSLGAEQLIIDHVGHSAYADSGTASVIPVPSREALVGYTSQVFKNNNWQIGDSRQKPNPYARAHAIPEVIGEPSLIKHVFLVVKENRTYDQVLGDIGRANSDPSLTDFGTNVTPNHHALATQFPLLDNFYVGGRQSADGHQWIVQGIAPDYIEKGGADFVRSYPYNGGDSMVYGPKDFLWNAALKHNLSVRVYGEYANQATVTPGPKGTWTDWYNDSQVLEGKKQGNLHVPVGAWYQSTQIPSLDAILDHRFPGFDTGVPDQYRMDMFLPEFKKYIQQNNLPQLIVMTLPSDHTSGTAVNAPTAAAQVADNDLAVGRLIDAVSHSPYWKDSAIFIEEDDAQNGVDHVDGHRSPVLVASPYAKRNGFIDHTYYTQINVDRTIEQILGITPMTQFDQAAMPMWTLFSDYPDLTPYTVLPNQIPLNQMNPGSVAQQEIERAWSLASTKMFEGKENKPDAENPNMLNHAIWYSATGFKRPYPGESKVLMPEAVALQFASNDADGDGD